MEATSVARPHGIRLAKPRRVLAAFSDERLVEHVRRGDEVAFEILYDRHNRGVLAFCRHMLRSADEAEDAVQHAFIAAYNNLHRGEERDIRFKAWLYTIARNRCLSILRARREHASDTIEISTDRLSEDVQHRADLQVLVADVSELPDDQREALVLAEVGDLSHAEVARIIGCEAAKVKSLVFQARTALIERRQARETPCSEIREQLATLRGGALRRSHLRHHLAACPGCSQYRDEVRRQRQMLALALPVVPSLGLRGHVLAAAGIGGGAAGGGGIGGGLAIAAKSGLAKAGIAALVVGGAAGGTVVATHSNLPVVGSSAQHDTAPAGRTGSAGGAASSASARHDAKTAVTNAHQPSHGRSASGTAHGFTPIQGESNGARAREFAATRGKGKHLGLTRTHHTATRTRPAHTRHGPAHVKARRAPMRRPAATPAPSSDSTPTTTTEQSAPSAPAPGSGNSAAGGKGGVAGLDVPAGK
ncbi:MAG: RNA polymerase sigma factor [Thermoleophilaceae bacterium]